MFETWEKLKLHRTIHTSVLGSCVCVSHQTKKLLFHLFSEMPKSTTRCPAIHTSLPGNPFRDFILAVVLITNLWDDNVLNLTDKKQILRWVVGVVTFALPLRVFIVRELKHKCALSILLVCHLLSHTISRNWNKFLSCLGPNPVLRIRCLSPSCKDLQNPQP